MCDKDGDTYVDDFSESQYLVINVMDNLVKNLCSKKFGDPFNGEFIDKFGGQFL